jgi:hypothetical protein
MPELNQYFPERARVLALRIAEIDAKYETLRVEAEGLCVERESHEQELRGIVLSFTEPIAQMQKDTAK